MYFCPWGTRVAATFSHRFRTYNSSVMPTLGERAEAVLRDQALAQHREKREQERLIDAVSEQHDETGDAGAPRSARHERELKHRADLAERRLETADARATAQDILRKEDDIARM